MPNKTINKFEKLYLKKEIVFQLVGIKSYFGTAKATEQKISFHRRFFDDKNLKRENVNSTSATTQS